MSAAFHYDVFRHLRDNEPPSFRHLHSPVQKIPVTVLTRHADVYSILLDTSSYSSYRGGTKWWLDDVTRSTRCRTDDADQHGPAESPAIGDSSRSFAVRAPSLTWNLTSGHSARKWSTTSSIADSEFVRDVAKQVPMQVIFMLLGVPEQDWAYLCELTDTMMNNGGTEAAMGAVLKLYIPDDLRADDASRQAQTW